MNKSLTTGNIGVIYIATGEMYVNAAIKSAQSVKKHSPNIQIDLFTDAELLTTHPFDRTTVIENPHRRSKVDYIDQTRFDRTLFLDSDTLVVDNISDIFELLDRYDIAAAHSHARSRAATQAPWRKIIPRSFPQVNSGVLLFKKSDSVLRLFNDWKTAFHTAGFPKDQVTFRELLWESDLALYILPPEYNIRYKKYLDIWEKWEAQPKILHFAEFHKKHKSAEVQSAPWSKFVKRLRKKIGC